MDDMTAELSPSSNLGIRTATKRSTTHLTKLTAESSPSSYLLDMTTEPSLSSNPDSHRANRARAYATELFNLDGEPGEDPYHGNPDGLSVSVQGHNAYHADAKQREDSPYYQGSLFSFDSSSKIKRSDWVSFVDSLDFDEPQALPGEDDDPFFGAVVLRTNMEIFDEYDTFEGTPAFQHTVSECRGCDSTTPFTRSQHRIQVKA